MSLVGFSVDIWVVWSRGFYWVLYGFMVVLSSFFGVSFGFSGAFMVIFHCSRPRQDGENLHFDLGSGKEGRSQKLETRSISLETRSFSRSKDHPKNHQHFLLGVSSLVVFGWLGCLSEGFLVGFLCKAFRKALGQRDGVRELCLPEAGSWVLPWRAFFLEKKSKHSAEWSLEQKSV